MTSCLVRLEGIEFSRSQGKQVLKGVSLDITPGSRTGIIGDNGAGKTTLLHIVMGLNRPDKGVIRLFGKQMHSETDFRLQRPRIGFVFQDADDQLFCPTVLEDVSFGPLNLGLSRVEALEKARDVLNMLELNDLQACLIPKLSGGQKKLVSLATVLAMDPELLILDEPTTGLDQNFRERFICILQETNLPRLIVSHDYDFLDRTCDDFFQLRNGRLEQGSAALLHVHKHAHPLGHTGHEHGDHSPPHRPDYSG
ncbi:MAG: energy-coupling factor ABC transporter ATP-binding protein [Desulfonatronovibrionaceae bacterium]